MKGRRVLARSAAGLRVVVCPECGLYGPLGHVSPDAVALAQVHDRIHHRGRSTAEAVDECQVLFGDVA